MILANLAHFLRELAVFFKDYWPTAADIKNRSLRKMSHRVTIFLNIYNEEMFQNDDGTNRFSEGTMKAIESFVNALKNKKNNAGIALRYSISSF